MKKKIAVIWITAFIVAGINGIAMSQISGGGGPGGEGGVNTGPNRGGIKRKPPCAEMNTGIDIARIIKRPNLAQDLGITPEQGKEIMNKADAVKTKMGDALDNACRLSEELKNAVLAESPDRGEISRLIDDLTYARQDLLKVQADILFDVLETLTPEQWAAFRQIAVEAQKPKGKGMQKKKTGQ